MWGGRYDQGMSPVTPATRPAGRPRASSRAMLEEAAGELFLERGYSATSVADITARAGVSRNTFFNYFGAKSDLLWSTFDATVAGLGEALADPRLDDGTPRGTARAALMEVAGALRPDNVSLAFTHADTMGLADELRRAAALRASDVAVVLTAFAVARGVEPLRAEVAGAAYAGALVAAVGEWSRSGAVRTSLSDVLARALEPVEGALP